MHSAAYLDSGISSLPASDLFKIANTPDIADLVTPDGLKQVFEVIAGMGPTRTAALLVVCSTPSASACTVCVCVGAGERRRAVCAAADRALSKDVVISQEITAWS